MFAYLNVSDIQHIRVKLHLKQDSEIRTRRTELHKCGSFYMLATVWICVCVYVFVWVCVHLGVYVCVRVFVYVCVCLACVWVYVRCVCVSVFLLFNYTNLLCLGSYRLKPILCPSALFPPENWKFCNVKREFLIKCTTLRCRVFNICWFVRLFQRHI